MIFLTAIIIGTYLVPIFCIIKDSQAILLFHLCKYQGAKVKIYSGGVDLERLRLLVKKTNKNLESFWDSTWGCTVPFSAYHTGYWPNGWRWVCRHWHACPAASPFFSAHRNQNYIYIYCIRISIHFHQVERHVAAPKTMV